MKRDIISYYRQRANEYDKIYLKPERQSDLNSATTILQNTFSGKSVFEIACGTGYWTEKIAKTAKYVIATDINETVIEIAKQKKYQNDNVTFQIADIFNLSETKLYENLFGGFIWSHIPLQDLEAFLITINKLVVPGAAIVFMDNIYVKESNIPVSQTDEFGNSFQTRKLEDESSYLVLKNFPTEAFLKAQVKLFAAEIMFTRLKYYWILTYTRRNETK